MGVRVVVDVGELVLHGFPPADRYAVGDAVRAELTRLVTDGGVPDAWAGGTARLDAGQVQVGATPDATGAAVARAVYGGGAR